MKQSKHKPNRVCGTTFSGFQNNSALIGTSCCMKGTIPCTKRIWYTDGKRTIMPKMFPKQHVENFFLEVLRWKVGHVKSEKTETSRHREDPEDQPVSSVLSWAAKWHPSSVQIFWRKRKSHESFWTVTRQPA